MEITRNVFGKSEQNEEFTRITLNLFVASHHCVTSHPDNASPDLDATDLHLTAERLLHCGLVIYKGGKYDLIVPDYSLWYGIEKDVALGGVLVEDASGAAATTRVSQILGYMGQEISFGERVNLLEQTHQKELMAAKAHYEGRLAEATVAFKAAFIPEGNQATVQSGWSCAGCCYNSNASACSFRAEPPDWLIARACHVDSPQRICPISSFWGVIRSTLTATVSYTHHGPPKIPPRWFGFTEYLSWSSPNCSPHREGKALKGELAKSLELDQLRAANATAADLLAKHEAQERLDGEMESETRSYVECVLQRDDYLRARNNWVLWLR
ncbi:hypothetical protein EN45_051040 [Penicillium chrysogenum]|uniref:Uncharacterized protein n=1 Tax=Penicillium chrysogenum TaxID=5076 RepID=A0A167RY78_PENCH|nr:hypothetical protein EN45_051040 [Penicillium chrysogenum]